MTEFIAYVSANWYGILIAGSAIITAAEFVVRLTPTKKDDGFVQRIANLYGKIFDFLKVPNVKKQDGSYIIPAGVHAPKEDKSPKTGE